MHLPRQDLESLSAVSEAPLEDHPAAHYCVVGAPDTALRHFGVMSATNRPEAFAITARVLDYAVRPSQAEEIEIHVLGNFLVRSICRVYENQIRAFQCEA